MRHISYAAMARILQSAVAECTIVTPIRYIIQYAETLSTDGIPDNILGREDIKRYMAMIDLAAERSSRARAAARRRAAMRSTQSPTGPDSTCSDSAVSNSNPNSSDSTNANSCIDNESYNSEVRPRGGRHVSFRPIKVRVTQARGYKPGYVHRRSMGRGNKHR